MPTTLVLVVPGFGGSELFLKPSDPTRAAMFGRQKIWLDVRRAGDPDSIQALRLDAPPAGGVIEPGGVLEDGYGTLVAALGRPGVLPRGWAVAGYGWDWRNSILVEAPKLAAFIQTRVPTLFDSVALVGHSLGGVLSVYTYKLLARSGRAGLVSRIVTLGSPLYGCYGTCQTWCGYESTLNLLASVSRALDTVRSLGLSGGASVAARVSAYLRVFMSWDSPYNLLPMPSHPEDPGDTIRATVYDPATWEHCPIPPDPARLAAARDIWWADFGDPSTTPPRNVIKCYSATGQPTPYRLHPRLYNTEREAPLSLLTGRSTLQRIQLTLPTFLTTSGGDGRVPLWASHYGERDYEIVSGLHEDMPSHPGILANLPADLLPQAAPPPPPSPAPPPVVTVLAAPVWPETRSGRPQQNLFNDFNPMATPPVRQPSVVTVTPAGAPMDPAYDPQTGR